MVWSKKRNNNSKIKIENILNPGQLFRILVVLLSYFTGGEKLKPEEKLLANRPSRRHIRFKCRFECQQLGNDACNRTQEETSIWVGV